MEKTCVVQVTYQGPWAQDGGFVSVLFQASLATSILRNAFPIFSKLSFFLYPWASGPGLWSETPEPRNLSRHPLDSDPKVQPPGTTPSNSKAPNRPCLLRGHNFLYQLLFYACDKILWSKQSIPELTIPEGKVADSAWSQSHLLKASMK